MRKGCNMQLLYQNHRRFQFSSTIRSLDFVPHLHSAVEIFFFTQGSSLVLHGNRWHRLSAGDVFIAFPNQIHGYEQSENVRGYLLIVPVKPYLSAYYSTLMNNLPTEPYLRKEQWEQSGLSSLLELADQDRATATEMVMQGYLHLIVGKLLSLLTLQERQPESNDALKQILLYLNEHYTESVGRGTLAKALGYTESYVSHIFSNTLKTTIPEYVNSLRIYDATRLLTQTDLSVTRIASDLGFGSIRNFNRVFLKQTGVTPKEYRQKHPGA